MADSLSPTIHKVLLKWLTNRQIVSIRTQIEQPVSIMEHYARISSKIIKFNVC